MIPCFQQLDLIFGINRVKLTSFFYIHTGRFHARSRLWKRCDVFFGLLACSELWSEIVLLCFCSMSVLQLRDAISYLTQSGAQTRNQTRDSWSFAYSWLSTQHSLSVQSADLWLSCCICWLRSLVSYVTAFSEYWVLIFVPRDASVALPVYIVIFWQIMRDTDSAVVIFLLSWW